MRSLFRDAVGVALAIAVSVLLSGCKGQSGPNTVPVSGRVTVGGKPVANIQVTFTPLQEGPQSVGVTDAEGKFTLKTVESTPRDGAVPGQHKVMMAWKNPEEDESVDYEENPPAPPVQLPENAMDGSMTFTVPPEGTDQANFDL